ncbi:MAG: cholesterol esterase [Actinobacteria bacterium 13_1_20CM_3_68_9]|nr:MAG: cholesterol esterase [Actinobacteria bacterium 13_1_20CM_3_68_9]
MNDAQGSPVLGGTRWRRFAVAFVPAVAVVGAIVVGMANGAIAASFSVSGSTFKVSADKLDGTGFVQYGGTVHDKAGNIHPVAVSGIKSASLSNLCQSVVVPGTPISLVIRAGRDPNHPATATGLLIDMTQLSGDATFQNISIGQDASTLDKGPSTAVGQAGGFGQQADSVVITGLHQIAWSTSAGTFALNGLDLSVSVSGEQCFT